jgi:hypothetical protein
MTTFRRIINSACKKEAGYDDWLRTRLEKTIQKLDAGEMPTYTIAQVRARMKIRRIERFTESLALPAAD